MSTTDKAPLKKERRHIIIPRYLDQAVQKSAEANDRSYSGQITNLLKGVYGDPK